MMRVNLPKKSSDQELPRSNLPGIPDHELIRSIASGAYGEVWLARSVVGTLRAVKIVRRDQHALAESFEREFKGLQKFEPISRVHEGLVDILTLGLLPDDAGFYYVMELADQAKPGANLVAADVRRLTSAPSTAQTIVHNEKSESPDIDCYVPRTLRAELKSRGGLPTDEVIALGLKLTSALAHLHASGLVHRDVKPSNILVIGGEPKLADAGLVAAVDDARSLVGTAGYIAPEGPGTPQADLYALGKVLYEAAFGKDRQEFPALPADVISRPDHTCLLELNAILLKACATDKRERYQSAEEMRGDLEIVRGGRSVKRRQAWGRTLTLATKFGAACAGLIVVTVVIYSLALERSRPPTVKRSPVAEANEEYKKGINELHLNLNAEEAIKHFEKAVQLDPKFADAYAQLADAWFSIPGESNKDNGTKAAEKAVLLDPQSGLARVFFAASKNFALDFEAAERETKHAVKLNPGSEEVLLASALIFATIGLTNDAMSNLKKAIDVGQDTPSKLRVIYSGFVYYWCREYDRAIAIYNEAPWLKDGVDGPHETQSRAYLAKGDYMNSMRLGRRSELERGGDTNAKQVNARFDALERAYKDGGQKQYWRLMLEYETPNTDDEHLMRLAAIYVHLDQRVEAFNCLRLARKLHPLYFGADIYTNPSFDKLRNDPEFKDLETDLWEKK